MIPVGSGSTTPARLPEPCGGQEGVVAGGTEMRIGIDVGGTFTDFLLTHDDGTSQVYKVLSTPDDPSP